MEVLEKGRVHRRCSTGRNASKRNNDDDYHKGNDKNLDVEAKRNDEKNERIDCNTAFEVKPRIPRCSTISMPSRIRHRLGS